MSDKELQTTNEKIAKEVVDRRGGKRSTSFGEVIVNPGDNTKFLRHARLSIDLPPIDISDQNQVAQRIDEYFTSCEEHDMKPNLVGMANWLGVQRKTLMSWRRGEYRDKTHRKIIERAVNLLEELWMDYMQNGKINPASGIFIAKNVYGYRDVQDVKIEPVTPLGEEADQKQLENKYAESMIDTTATVVDVEED